jgi:hypothetical protein
LTFADFSKTWLSSMLDYPGFTISRSLQG